jgi:hypothetical protein
MYPKKPPLGLAFEHKVHFTADGPSDRRSKLNRQQSSWRRLKAVSRRGCAIGYSAAAVAFYGMNGETALSENSGCVVGEFFDR